MSTYIDVLKGLPRHDHLVVKEVLRVGEGMITIEFEPNNIISNCIYGFDMEYGMQFEVQAIIKNTATFSVHGNWYDEEDLKKEAENIKPGDKMGFYSVFPIGGEYHNGSPYKYAEL